MGSFLDCQGEAVMAEAEVQLAQPAAPLQQRRGV
jgi:hypothetical protein